MAAKQVPIISSEISGSRLPPSQHVLCSKETEIHQQGPNLMASSAPSPPSALLVSALWDAQPCPSPARSSSRLRVPCYLRDMLLSRPSVDLHTVGSRHSEEVNKEVPKGIPFVLPATPLLHLEVGLFWIISESLGCHLIIVKEQKKPRHRDYTKLLHKGVRDFLPAERRQQRLGFRARQGHRSRKQKIQDQPLL